MKKAASTIEDRALRALSELGLTENELKIAERWINSDGEDASILDELKARDLSGSGYDYVNKVSHIVETISELLKKGMEQKARRTMEYLFALGHSTANFLLEKRWLLELSEVEKMLPRDTRAQFAHHS